MFDNLKLSEEQKACLEEFGFIRMTLDDALDLLEPHKVGIKKIGEALGMHRSNVRSHFRRGCVLDFEPETNSIRMVRIEETLKEGHL